MIRYIIWDFVWMTFLLSLIFLAYALVGCATFPDKPACVPEVQTPYHPERLYCDTTLDVDEHEKFYVDNVDQFYIDSQGKQWNMDELKRVSYIVPPETWSAIQGFVLKFCHQNSSNCPGIGQWINGNKLNSIANKNLQEAKSVQHY